MCRGRARVLLHLHIQFEGTVDTEARRNIVYFENLPTDAFWYQNSNFCTFVQITPL
jgi:hypothetical protein